MEEDLLSGKYLYNITRKSGKTQILKYNIKTFELERTYIWTREALSKNTCIVELPNNELFCYGNNNPRTGISYIIDLKSMTIKRRIFDGIPCCNASGLYFQNSIFFLRGTHVKHYSSRIDKYDLIENRWKICFNFYNILFDLCSCTAFKNSILFCSANWKILYQFDICINSSSDILVIEDSAHKFKILFTGNSRAYIAVKSIGIFESEIENQFLWQNIGNFNCDFNINYCVFKKYMENSILISFLGYFDLSCYKFDLKTKEMTKMKLKYC